MAQKYCYFFGAVVMLSMISCFAPRHSFENTAQPPPPDYSQESCWAALPWKKDSADAVPRHSGLRDNQSQAEVDVFFIHPTSYLKRKSWNGYMNDRKLNHRTDKQVILNQATVFNGSCKVYAPRYRQATLYSYYDYEANGKKALDFAYQDVRAAFIYYLKNYNHGRPIIIASHSQGSRHAFQLIEEFFEHDSARYHQLVCAYILGANTDHEFLTVVPCDSASQTGCMNAWRTARWGKEPGSGFFQKASFCTNPLSWRRDSVYVPREQGRGGARFHLKKIDEHLVDAMLYKDILWVHKPHKPGYARFVRNYHLDDYNFFWLDIRANVALRCEAYLKRENIR